MNQPESDRRPGRQMDPAAGLNALDLALQSQQLDLETTEFLRNLLPVFDGVLSLCPGLDEQPAEKIAAKAEAISMLAEITEQALLKMGLERYGKEGELVNRTRHEVVDTQPRDDVPRGTILEVLEAGWEYEGKSLRYARVVASRRTDEAGN